MVTADSANYEPPPTQVMELVLQPPRGWPTINLRELWQHRELVYFLAWRDVKIRYKQTVLGVLWAILQPVLMMVVFTVVFGRMAKVPTGNVPYPIFVYAGLLPWSFFSRAISAAAESIVRSEKMVTKIYFPRLAIPIASVGAALVDLAISFSVLGVLMWYYRVAPTWSLLWVPALCLLTTAAALGFGTILAALNVAYRDVRYVIPFLMQIWLFATPTVYMETQNADAESGRWAASAAESPRQGPSDTQNRTLDAVRHALDVNPLTGLIAFFRATVVGRPLPWSQLAWSASIIVPVLIAGLFYFRRVESSFADIV